VVKLRPHPQCGVMQNIPNFPKLPNPTETPGTPNTTNQIAAAELARYLDAEPEPFRLGPPVKYSVGTKFVRASVHIASLGVAAIGGVISLLFFASASAAREGRTLLGNLFGAGAGVPDLQHARSADLAGLVVALITIGVFVAVQKTMADTRRPHS
jgi:hypothetical protein